MLNRVVGVFACVVFVACGEGDEGSMRGDAPADNGFGNAPDRNGFSNAGVAGQSGSAMGGVSTGDSCAQGDARAARVKPTVHLVIDGSGSMNDDFGGVSRWNALRSALMDPDGVVPTLESTVEFGMVLYDGAIAGEALEGVADLLDGIIPGLGVVIPQPGDSDCPRIVTVPPALDNFTTLDDAYPQMPLGGSTPTHAALQSAMDQAVSRVQTGPDQEGGPQYVVLATDGEPNDLCSGDLALDVRPAVISAVEQGAARGVKTFVISLAGQDAALQAHLEQVAAAGNTGQAPFTPMSKNDLVDVLTQIIGGAVTCQVRLSGRVEAGSECLGSVVVNGFELPCNDPNGWKLVDASTIELTGQACSDFRGNSEAMLRATFPCGVFRPD